MPYNTKGDVLAQGKSCVVRINPGSANSNDAQKIGFVESWTVRRSYQTQKAEVVGTPLPVSIDVVGVEVNVNLSGFIPSAGTLTSGIDSLDGGGKYYVKQLMPRTDSIADASELQKIPYMDFYDEAHKTIITCVTWLTPTENSESSQGKNYLKTDASFQAISSENGSQYTVVIGSE